VHVSEGEKTRSSIAIPRAGVRISHSMSGVRIHTITLRASLAPRRRPLRTQPCNSDQRKHAFRTSQWGGPLGASREPRQQ